MTPALVALSGPLRGSTFALEHSEISIGRDPSSSLVINDSLVSRNHCLIRKVQDQFVIQDLDSRNGIIVNNLPVKERALQHADQLVIGDSLFMFVHRDETPAQTSEGYDPIIVGDTTELRLEDVIYLEPGNLQSASTAENNLRLLVKASTLFHSLSNIHDLQAELIEMAFKATPAERAAVLIDEGIISESFSVFARSRHSSSHGFSVSRTITERVKNGRVAILSNDIKQDQSFVQSQSLAVSRINSMICVPMTSHVQFLGALYLDTSDEAIHFDQDHLQIATALAGIAALALKNLHYIQWLQHEKDRLVEEAGQNMIGESSGIRKVQEIIAKVSPSDSTVLICGESGTGKELVAHAIHRNSSRKDKAFVAINCAVLAETLFESELFGHEKGAFTGAISQKKGKLEFAEGGTVFLDEISEIPPAIQAKLLRVIQEREFEHVGGTHLIKTDVRWIAATNRNLEESIQSGKFRSDLFYRLKVVEIALPSLRERREDIPLLTNYFVTKYSNKLKRRVKGIDPKAREILNRYDWPGNIRELENAIERAVVLGSTELVQVEDLPESLLEIDEPAVTNSLSYHAVMRDAKKQLILKTLKQTNGNYTDAAKMLGVHPTYLHRLIKNLNLKELIKS